MAFDEELGNRVREVIGARKGLTEKKMFGGLAFLLNGNMACGVHGDQLIVRVDPASTDKVLSQPHTSVFDLTGRPMKGWILVDPKGLGRKPALTKWVNTGLDYAASLPKK